MDHIQYINDANNLISDALGKKLSGRYYTHEVIAKNGIKAMLNWLIVSVVIIGVFYTGSLILALNRYFEVSKIIK